MIDQKRITAFDQTMKELKGVRKRAQMSGNGRRFQNAWVDVVKTCWASGTPVERISPVKVYEKCIST